MSDCPPQDVTPQSSTQEVLRSVLTKPSEDSKKYQITVLGLQILAGAFLVSVALSFVKPSLAANIQTMCQIFLTAVGGLISVYLGGQSASEWKASASLATATNSNEETKTLNENKKIEIIRTTKAAHFDGDDIP